MPRKIFAPNLQSFQFHITRKEQVARELREGSSFFQDGGEVSLSGEREMLDLGLVTPVANRGLV